MGAQQPYQYYQGYTTFINVYSGVKQPLSMLSGMYNLYHYYKEYTTILSILSGVYKNLYHLGYQR